MRSADAAFEAGLAGLRAALRAEHPEFFDESGELRRDKVLRLLVRRANGKKVVSGSEFLALVGRGDAASTDAP